MKIRNGFVSNSSSSSYIIALKKDTNVCPHCGRKDPDILDFIRHAGENNDENRVMTDNTKDTLRYIREQYTNAEEIAKKAEEYEDNEEYNVVCVDISYHSESILTVLNNLISSKNAVKIYSIE